MFLTSPMLTKVLVFLFLFTGRCACRMFFPPHLQQNCCSSVKYDSKYCFVSQLPVEHHVVGEKSRHQHFYQSDREPQHKQHNRAKDHHRQDEPPQVSVDG